MNKQYPLVDVDSYIPFNRNYAAFQVKEFIDQFIKNPSGYEIFEISAYGKDVVPVLLEYLTSITKDIKNISKNKIDIIAAILNTLEKIGAEAKEAIATLIKLLDFNDSTVKFRAAWALAGIGPAAASAVPKLITLLQDSSENQIDSAAANALGEIGSAAKEAIPALIISLRKGNSSAVKALVKISQKGILALIPLLTDQNDAVCSVAIDGLRQASSNSESERINLILIDIARNKNKKNDLRLNAMYALKQVIVNTKIESVVASTINILKDTGDKNDIRSEAASVLAKISRGDDYSVSALIEALQDKEEQVRLSAARAIGAIGKNAKATIPVLIKIVKEQETELAAEAAKALGLIGPEAKEAVPVLISVLRKPKQDRIPEDYNIRSFIQDSATSALGRMGFHAVQELIGLINENIARVRAMIALRMIGHEAFTARESMMNILQDQSDKKSSLLAAMVVSEFGADAESALPILLSTLNSHDTDNEIRAEIALSIGKFGYSASPAIPTLICMAGARIKNSSEALIKIGFPAVPLLIASLGDKDNNISSECCHALIEIGAASIPALIIALRDVNLEIRRRAAFVLSRIGAIAVHSLLVALQDNDANVRIGAIYALCVMKQHDNYFINFLIKTVENKESHFDERRIAAYALDLMGYDVTWVFRETNIASPSNAICRCTELYEFDLYTGRCLQYYRKGIPTFAGGGCLLRGLCRFFGC